MSFHKKGPVTKMDLVLFAVIMGIGVLSFRFHVNVVPIIFVLALVLSLIYAIKTFGKNQIESYDVDEQQNVINLSCPSCGAPLKVSEDKIQCSRCGHTENVDVADYDDDGIIDLIMFTDREVQPKEEIDDEDNLIGARNIVPPPRRKADYYVETEFSPVITPMKTNEEEPLIHTEAPEIAPGLFTDNTSTVSKKETVPEAFAPSVIEIKTVPQAVVPSEVKVNEQNEYQALALKAFEKDEIKYFLKSEYEYRPASVNYGSPKDWKQMADGVLKAFEEFGDASAADKLNDALEDLMNGFTEEIYYAFSILSVLLEAEDNGRAPEGFSLERERLLSVGMKSVKNSEYSLKANSSEEGKNDPDGLYGVIMKSYAGKLLNIDDV